MESNSPADESRFGSIEILDPLLADQIAAGEVIDRPSSVVKELVENAIDSGARNIEVKIKSGGKSLIEVTDDGEGMTRADLAKSILRHATSKIRERADLDNISTLGFRGEALPSIASVSKMTLISKRAGGEAYRLEALGGVASEPIESSYHHRSGSMVVARDLFYNTPARRKFMRSEALEAERIESTTHIMGLARPDLSFKLYKGRRVIYNAPARSGPRSWLDRIVDTFGAELEAELVPIESTLERLSLRGYISRPGVSRATGRWRYTFVNRRFLRERLINLAVMEGYRSLLMKGRYPLVFLDITTPPGFADFNVHPSKIEARFYDNSAISTLTRDAIRAAFTRSGSGGGALEIDSGRENGDALIARVGTPFDAERNSEPGAPPSNYARRAQAEPPPSVEPEPRVEKKSAERPPTHADQQVQGEPSEHPGASERLEREERRSSSTGHRADAKPARRFSPSEQGIQKESVALNASEQGAQENRPGALPARQVHKEAIGRANVPARQTQEEATGRPNLKIFDRVVSSGYRAVGQLFNLFILIEDGARLLVIDQHTAHERVLFEKIAAKYRLGPVASQTLLTPPLIELPTARFDHLRARLEVFDRLGYLIEEFGERTLAIRSAPALLARVDHKSLILDLFERVDDYSASDMRFDHLAEEMIATMACRAAVKANDPLSVEMTRQIVDDLTRCELPYNCPHGRPVSMELTKLELERLFLRR